MQEAVPGNVVRAAGAALGRVDDAVEPVADSNLMRREQEHGDGEHREDDEMDRAVDSDDAQHNSIPKRLSSKRELDLLARRWSLTCRRRRRRERHPRVAADAAIPADALLLARNDRILGPEPGGVGPDQLMAAYSTDEQLPVKARPETARLLGTRRAVHRRGC